MFPATQYSVERNRTKAYFIFTMRNHTHLRLIYGTSKCTNTFVTKRFAWFPLTFCSGYGTVVQVDQIRGVCGSRRRPLEQTPRGNAELAQHARIAFEHTQRRRAPRRQSHGDFPDCGYAFFVWTNNEQQQPSYWCDEFILNFNSV